MKKIFPFTFTSYSAQILSLNILHILNDGYSASLLLFLPFIAQDMRLSLTEVGLLGTIMASLGFFLALPGSYVAQKIGGMRILIAAVFFYGFGYLVTGLAPTYSWLFPAFFIGGMGLGVFHPIGFALITKWSTKGTLGRQMGNFTSMGEVGRIGLAALLTFIIAAIGWRYTAILYASIAIGIAFLLLCFLRRKREQVTLQDKQVKPLPLKDIITHKKFIFAAMSSFFDAFASTSLFLFLPFLLLKRGVDPAFLGSLAAAYFIGNLAGKTMLGRFADKFSNTKIFIISELFMAFFIVLLAYTTSLPLIIMYSIILGIFTKGTVPIIQTMISESAEHHGNFEKAFGADSTISRIGTTSAPVLLGFISDTISIIAAFLVMAGAALIAIIPAIGFQLMKGK